MKTITLTEEYRAILIAEEDAEQEHEPLRGTREATAVPIEKFGRANAARKKNNT